MPECMKLLILNYGYVAHANLNVGSSGDANVPPICIYERDEQMS